MRAIQSCMPSATQAGRKGTFAPAPSANDVARVERLIRETRRVLGVLDRELDEIRSARETQMAMAADQSESVQNETGKTLMEATPLPQNVVTVSRELFVSEAPKEMVLDPELEKALSLIHICRGSEFMVTKENSEDHPRVRPYDTRMTCQAVGLIFPLLA